ncbi:putative Transposon Tf2-6 polyprotein [Nannochloris sp. 'desiccata']|nr:putative Transposon Tf2-6 polyprotein [Chlorella desiccata (nom. nud.)]
MEELSPVLKKIKNQAGMIGTLRPELLKASVEHLGPAIVELLNASVAIGKLPKVWALSAITPIAKPGSDHRTCDGYRGIAVGTLAAKLYGSMLDHRIDGWAEASGIRAKGQFGFRKGKGTASASFIVRTLFDQVRTQKGGRLYTCFVDFKKAYDSVPRHLLWAKLERRGVTGWVLDAIKAMYADVPMCVKSSTGLGKVFQSNLGVKQGCPLSPLLFGLYLDDWDAELKAASEAPDDESDKFDFPNLAGEDLRSLMYADDLMQAATSIDGLRKQMALLEDFSARWGLTINASKTKVMVFSRLNSPHVAKTAVLKIGGEVVEVVERFKYLGTIFHCSQMLSRHAVPARAYNGRRAYHISRRRLAELQLGGGLEINFRLFDVMVDSVLGYGAEVWAPELLCNDPLSNDCERVHLFALKWLLGVRKSTASCIVLAETGRWPLAFRWVKRIARFYNGLVKAPADSILKRAFIANCQLTSNPAEGSAKCMAEQSWAAQLQRAFKKFEVQLPLEEPIELNVNDVCIKWKEFYLNRVRTETGTKIKKYVHEVRNGLPEYEAAPYLGVSAVSDRRAMTQAMTGSHFLMEEVGRWNQLAKEDRVCKQCAEKEVKTVETAEHLFFHCPSYDDIRADFPCLDFTLTNLHEFSMQQPTQITRVITRPLWSICFVLTNFIDDLVMWKLCGDCPFDLVLGKPWFDEKNPQIDWPNNLITLQHDGKTIAFRADYHDQKHLKKNGLISAVEMEAELSSGNIVHFCVIKPIPEKYENYEYGSDGKNLERNGLEKHVDMLVDEFVDVFDPDLPLPVDREIEHEIELEPGASPVAQQMYRLSFEELAELKTQILDYLNRGFIRPSKSPYGAPILFVRKKSGALRMCVDYRGLNRITKKNRCPLPRIDDLLDKLAGAKYFTSLDLKSAYHQIKIKEEDIEKTAFRTPFGHFEFVVLPFGLCNAPATFQTLMNNVFRDELHQFVLCYLDDIMIFSKSLQAHIQHVRHVFEKLRKNKLFVNKEKCLFFQTKIAWLGYIISENGIKVDQSKISTILEWPVPKNTIDILSFLGFTGYYRKFIEKYSHIAAPMTELLKKDISFIWTPTQQQAFETLKSKLTTAPILILPSPDFPFEMYTDASDFAFGGVLMQDQGQGLKPVAFSSKKLSEAERKYDIYEKEALSQIHHLKLWRCYIQSAHRSTAYTDNNVLKYLQTQPRLSPRQARWMEVLSQFNVYVEYITGKANVVADALSRRPDFAMTVVFACQDSDWLLQLKESYKESPEAKKIIQLIQEKQSRDYVFDHGYIVRRTPENTQLYVPEGPLRKELVEEHHDSLLAGHFGVAKTAALLLRCYYWPQLQRDVRRGVQSCERCGASKSSNQKKAGLLQPLPTPTRRFEVITMDFVTSLPDVDNFNAIMIMVDKLTKRVFLAPTTDKVTAEEAATLFYRHVVRNQGVPSTIISDRGTQFTSIFWKSMIAQLGIKHKLSTAYHPQTDGQSEITVRIVVDMLRTLHQEYPNWVQILPAVEFAINNSKNVSTGKTPFFLCYGEEVPTPPTLNLQALAKLNPNQPSVDFAARTQIAIQEAQRMLAEAQRKQKYYADQGRRHLTFEEGDQVYISTADLPLKGPRKLAPKWFGPIPVVKKLSPLNYQVALPPIWRRRYPIFHVEKLKPFVQSTEFPNRYPARPPPDLEQGPDVFNVEKILDRRSTPWGRGFKVEYYVKWEGYPLCDSTWEPKSNFRDAGTEVKRMLREIDQQHDAT